MVGTIMIRVRVATKNKLDKLKLSSRETYDDTVSHLIKFEELFRSIKSREK